MFISERPCEVRQAFRPQPFFDVLHDEGQGFLVPALAAGRDDGLGVGSTDQPPAVGVEDADSVQGQTLVVLERLVPDAPDDLELLGVRAVDPGLGFS